MSAPTLRSESHGFFGHPRALATLFSTELWERFSFTGMRALLFLYMTTQLSEGGLGLSVATAGSVLGTYGALLYVGGVLGGWLADHYVGPRRAVLYGGSLIILGHVFLSRTGGTTFVVGLLLLLLGTSLFKPSMSSLVGMLYPPGDRRRDAGFALFYMGINIGGFLAPLICGFLAQSEQWKAVLRRFGAAPENSWHWGFGAAAVGMALGLGQFVASASKLGRLGLLPSQPAGSGTSDNRKRRVQAVLGGLGLLLLAVAVLQVRGVLHIDLVHVSRILGYLVLLLPAVYVPLLFVKGRFSGVERQRMSVVIVLFLFMIIFWAAENQAGSSLTLFAQRHTRNTVFGYDFPSVWWISVSPLLVISLSPLIGWVWLRMGRHEPSSPTKFVFGLTFTGLGFLILTIAAMVAARSGQRVNPAWLLTLFVFDTLGELCLSPTGLSMVTKLAPVERGNQLMGLWFLAVSTGSVVGGWVAGSFETLPLPKLFGSIAAVLWVAAFALAILGKTLRRLMSGVA